MPADRAEYAALRHASRDWLQPWEPLRAGGFDALASEDAFRIFVTDSKNERRQRYFVCDAATGAIIGQVALNEIIRGPLQQAFLGYWIGKPFAGRGLMTEALRLTLTFAFDSLQLHRVEANIMPRNERSIALIRRLGFRREGYSPKYLEIGGIREDHERWAILREEFGRVRGETD